MRSNVGSTKGNDRTVHAANALGTCERIEEILDDAIRTKPADISVPGMKEPICKLLTALEASGVRYCHWKSNIRLEETLAGAQDIDLLVDRRDAVLFHAILTESGFKLAESRSGVGHPGVFHAVALDESTAQLVDLHAHYQIISGDSLVKNYRLPIEDLLLARTRHLHGVKVPAPEVELLLFVLRIALKHISPVEILKVSLHYREVSSELAWLREAADLAEMDALRERWFPSIELALFRRLSLAIAEDDALLRRVVLGWRVAWRLRKLRRLSLAKAVTSRFWRTCSFAIRRLRRRRDLVLQTGGAIIALVGPKGTGKSTIGRELAARLGRYLLVSRIHAGKPPATALSLLPRLLVPLARVLLPHERLAEYEKPERRHRKTYSLLYVFRMTLLAHERRKLLFHALRAATSGAIVISDRFPSDVVGATDSSRFDEEAMEKSRFSLKRLLMAKERAMYSTLPKPSLVLRLVAPIETAIQRDAERVKRGGPNAEVVRRRWDLEMRAEFATAPTVLIDTASPLDETICTAVRAVWNAL